MESIATLKEVATKAIWGTDESHQEPISGVNGDVSKGEPYDAGNMGSRCYRPPLAVLQTHRSSQST